MIFSQGAGTRGGNGKCECDNEYTGETCEECSDEYYDAGNKTCKSEIHVFLSHFLGGFYIMQYIFRPCNFLKNYFFTYPHPRVAIPV